MRRGRTLGCVRPLCTEGMGATGSPPSGWDWPPRRIRLPRYQAEVRPSVNAVAQQTMFVCVPETFLGGGMILQTTFCFSPDTGAPSGTRRSNRTAF